MWWISLIAERLGNSEITYSQMVTEQDALSSKLISQLAKPGYSQVRISNPDGSYCVKRVYTSDYLQYQQSDQAWLLYKAVYLAAFILSIAMSAFVMMLLFSMGHIAVGVLEILAHLFLLYLLCMMLCQISAPRRMKLRQYERGGKELKSLSIVYGLILTAVFAVILYAFLAGGGPVSNAELFCIVGQALSAILIFLIFGLEKSRSFIYVKNELPDNMEIIG